MLELPLSVYYTQGKKQKKFILNLNQYRNTHYIQLNKAKEAYKNYIWYLLPKISFKEPVELIYTYYHGTAGKIDISNPCSIIDKFTCDVLTEKKIIPDDNMDFIKRVTYLWGGIDRENPRCTLEIKKL